MGKMKKLRKTKFGQRVMEYLEKMIRDLTRNFYCFNFVLYLLHNFAKFLKFLFVSPHLRERNWSIFFNVSES